ncbi:MAG TPA: biopolymer transporter ExbD [Leptospiraceae bacterium]|nr:biopolymer transporter ExbD [Leptospirales bacterium]HMU83445.1 biopolymer transporter ExbD [Leptospiraceae bacterium]HMW59475.1 biopolymer transporter ExbD [Leptospiraceae bacterium]HMX57878.1 biopolymer transporter ExbD [Leptospiraceae bacterium]HMY46873.1 biopolymer transporter ExbD [Leptospiraceae bacterium]
MVHYRANKTQLFSGINIVPFTDVVLVLLIVFMISAPGLLNTAMNIKLPGSTQATKRSDTKITVGLDASGKIFVNNEVVAREKVQEKVKELLKGESGEILLNADMKSHHGEVVELLDLLRQSGGNNVFIGTVRK